VSICPIAGAGLIGLVSAMLGYAFIKILLRQHEQNVTPLSQEGEYRTLKISRKIFLFLYFSYRNSPGYAQVLPVYAQTPSYPQFKKVFSLFAV
jgi:hypothetical protein